MPKGSCSCGEYTYEIPQSPTMQVICHCIPCRKFAGSNGSTNSVVSRDQYKRLSGDIRTWTRKGDSGKDVTNNYCANCNNLMFVEADFMPDYTIIKTGTLDDKEGLDNAPIVQEVYTQHRPNCFEALKDAQQKGGQTD